ncbi:MAG: hypothetical protein PGN11_03195 [Quadrisphaera sp.]
MQQFDLKDPGDISEPRELGAQNAESFEVTGSASGLEWVCTWTRTESANGVTIKTSINKR